MSNQYLNIIKVNEHILVATPRRSVADVGEAAIHEMARNRLLPNFDGPLHKSPRNQPFIERGGYTVGERITDLGILQYALPVPFDPRRYSRAEAWESPLVFQIIVTNHVTSMLSELDRAIRENLKVFI